MLEHQKLILENIYYDKELFEKELIKSYRWLKSYEIFELRNWLIKNFEPSHSELADSILMKHYDTNGYVL